MRHPSTVAARENGARIFANLGIFTKLGIVLRPLAAVIYRTAYAACVIASDRKRLLASDRFGWVICVAVSLPCGAGLVRPDAQLPGLGGTRRARTVDPAAACAAEQSVRRGYAAQRWHA